MVSKTSPDFRAILAFHLCSMGSVIVVGILTRIGGGGPFLFLLGHSQTKVLTRFQLPPPPFSQLQRQERLDLIARLVVVDRRLDYDGDLLTDERVSVEWDLLASPKPVSDIAHVNSTKQRLEVERTSTARDQMRLPVIRLAVHVYVEFRYDLRIVRRADAWIGRGDLCTIGARLDDVALNLRKIRFDDRHCLGFP